MSRSVDLDIHSWSTQEKKRYREMDELHKPNQIEGMYLPLRVFILSIHAGDALATMTQVLGLVEKTTPSAPFGEIESGYELLSATIPSRRSRGCLYLDSYMVVNLRVFKAETAGTGEQGKKAHISRRVIG